ncbi:MAG: hypothetical protein ABL904_10945 [Hyphomicrobiaceae bacterium]
MRLETAQVLELLGLTKETLRHWKKVISPLAGRDGRSAGYTFDEVTALALIASAVRDLQVPISRFSPVAHRLFQGIADHVEDANTTTVLCITHGDVALYPIDKLPGDACLALVRLAPVVRRLRLSLTPEPRSDPQLSLDFTSADSPAQPAQGLTESNPSAPAPGQPQLRKTTRRKNPMRGNKRPAASKPADPVLTPK